MHHAHRRRTRQTFVGKITRDSSVAPKLEKLVETILGAHRKGDKSTEKSAAKAFVEGLPTNFGPKEQTGTLKLLTAFVKKNARFTYAAAFAKKKTEIKKILGLAKKGDTAKVESEMQSLYSSMRSSGEIPKTIKFASFSQEMRDANKDLIVDERGARRTLKKADVQNMDFGKFMSSNSIKQSEIALVRDLAMSVWNKGEKDKKTIADAEFLIAQGGLKKATAKKLAANMKKMLEPT